MSARNDESDRALWQKVLQGVKPLRKRSAAATAPAVSKPAPAERAKPAPRPPAPSTKAPAPRQTKARDLGHGERIDLDRRSAERLSRGQLPIEGRLDLHGSTQAAAVERLASFLARAQGEGKRCVLVITGKGGSREGSGVLREQVPRWLNQQPNRTRVLAFDYARPQHGGEGALYVLLKRRRDL
jgi:DNA-nicking Smr family endonuclease